MLKFIGKVYRLCRVRKAFQNILCWSLSISVFLVFLDWSYFKTSYVEVYLSSTNIPKGYLEFQNILCWSLSNFWKRSCYFRLISKHLMLKFIEDAAALTIYLKRFQNILCWSLSNTFRVPDRQILHFKTSYVEVYRVFRSRSISNYIISKHLMLKFINVLWTFVGLLKKISKHLMLKFIALLERVLSPDSPFQNILCWSLSICCPSTKIRINDFKTSYVEVYPTFSRYFYLFSPSFFLISIIFTKHQPIFFFLSNISQIPRLYNTFSTFFFFSPGKYFYNSQSGMGCSSDIFTTENAWS